ncbi:MAG: ribose-phosphate diphosphokinase [Myxococcota bacterium]
MKQACVVVVLNSNHLSLAQALASKLGADVIQAAVHRFPDGELEVQMHAHVKNSLICVLQSLTPPVNEHLVQLMLLLNILRSAEGCRTLAIVPYFGYARQKQTFHSCPLHLFHRLLCTAGALKVLSFDTHGIHRQNRKAFPCLQHIQTLPLFVQDIQNRLNTYHIKRNKAVIVSPDEGGVNTALACAQKLGIGLAVVNKKRLPSGRIQAASIQGDLTNRTVAIVLDDLIDTGQTILQTAHLLRKQNIPSVWAYATHALLTNPSAFFEQSHVLDHLVVTDTIAPSQKLLKCERVRLLSCIPILAQAICAWLI